MARKRSDDRDRLICAGRFFVGNGAFRRQSVGIYVGWVCQSVVSVVYKELTFEKVFGLGSLNTKRSPISPGQSVLVSAFAVFVAFILLHLRFAPVVAGSFTSDAYGVPVVPNSFVFALTGAAFLGLTFFAHAWTVRGLGPVSEEKRVGNPGVSVGPALLLIPMAIRFVGTFAILGCLLVFGAVGRYEAVFDILFWYVTLTTLEVVGIVWAFGSVRANETSSLQSRPDTV